MLVTVVVTFCRIALGPPHCVEQVVTDQATLMGCAIHQQIGVADWMLTHPVFSHGWHVEKIGCALGYQPKRDI